MTIVSPIEKADVVDKRKLGSDGPEVGCIGFGCLALDGMYDGKGPADSNALIARSLELGCNVLDMSDLYGEEPVGRAIAGRRDEVVLTTACGWAADGSGLRSAARPEDISAAIDQSLRRLGTDHVDVFFLQCLDPDVPVEESVGAMAELVGSGKTRGIGLCEVGVSELERAMAVHPLAAVQSELSLWTRDWLADVLPWCAERGIAFMPFAPLGSGFLTGRFKTELPQDDARSEWGRFSADSLAANQRIVQAIETVAARHEATSGQVALAWLLAQGEMVIPIPSTKSIEHLEENAAAAQLSLTADDLAELDALPTAVGVRGPANLV